MVLNGVESEENKSWHLSSHIIFPEDPLISKGSNLKCPLKHMRPPWAFVFLKFLLPAVPGSLSELAANVLYYLRPFTQGGNKICIQASTCFYAIPRNATSNNWMTHWSSVIIHKDSRRTLGPPVSSVGHEGLPASCWREAIPASYLMSFLGL